MNDAGSGTVCVAAAAKLNLYLHVTGRRADGYHELDSLIAFAAVHDTVCVERGESSALRISGPFASSLIGGPGENLVERALRRLSAHVGRPANAHLSLYKRLPVAAGLGGGSADAAATLRALPKLWGLASREGELLEIALELGADIPVCLLGHAAHVGGIGEAITPYSGLPPCGLVLVNPGVALSTPAVFAAREGPFSEPARLEGVPSGARALARALAGRNNDLEAPACRLVPEISEVLGALGSLPGCLLARMSGSGATCFALFEDKSLAEHAAQVLAATHEEWWITASELIDDATALSPTVPD